MKTTYVYHKKKPEGVDKQAIIDTYINLKEKSDNIKASTEVNTEQSVSQKVKEESSKKGKKKSKLHLIIGLIAVIAVIGVGGAYIYSTKFAGEFAEDVQAYVDALYIDEEKSDVISITESDLDVLYAKVSELKEKNRDTGTLEEELNTISMYLSDREALKGITDPEYNLADEEYMSTIESVQSNIDKYTVEGLASTMSITCDSAMGDYNNYSDLKSTLQGITDLNNFNESDYSEVIEGITHMINKEEMEAFVYTISVDKNLANAQAELDAMYVDEEGNPVEPDEDVVSEKSLEVFALTLEQQEAQIKLAEVHDRMNGTSTAEDLRKQYESLTVTDVQDETPLEDIVE